MVRSRFDASGLVCWRCGASLAALPLPIGRRDTCPECRAELHVCRLCRFYDPAAANACREPVAERVTDKERANFCGYFEPRPGAWSGASDEAAAARAALEELFGEGEGPAGRDEDDPRRALEKLFGGSPDSGGEER